MTDLDPIWSRARNDLVIATESGGEYVLLWEHGERVARWAQQIAGFPIIQRESPDEAATVAAALYHDAGWVTRLQTGEARPQDILIRPVPDTHYEQSASLMERSLAGLLPARTLERASSAIRALDDRRTRLIEAHIISDAASLGEFCLVALWPTIRRGALEGKGVQAAIDTWHRRKEYRFWTARLKDLFRFAPVRDIARARLATYERMMTELQEHHEGADITLALTNRQAERSERSSI